MWFKVGDLSRTASESLGIFYESGGIPAIPRPRINTEFLLLLDGFRL